MIANDPRWAQVLARDAGADGSFFYSVRTSGVYCRPSCAARPARPENVAFHPTAADAEKAGFRPCKRCRPDQPREVIRYCLGPTALGQLLVAQSLDGICALLLGDDAAVLKADLAHRFPKAGLVEDGALAAFPKAAALMADPSAKVDLPLDPRGTEFQRSVWNALCGIPAGQTVSYAELAGRIGKPDAVRAVASACGANPIAVVIPCHRVLRSDGALSGYRWGVARKQQLLAAEARA
jgi:AraC family transcriptional regulator of adaptative response/methylated-DNA-[protein]-cysteine methyltransferase